MQAKKAKVKVLESHLVLVLVLVLLALALAPLARVLAQGQGTVPGRGSQKEKGPLPLQKMMEMVMVKAKDLAGPTMMDQAKLSSETVKDQRESKRMNSMTVPEPGSVQPFPSSRCVSWTFHRGLPLPQIPRLMQGQIPRSYTRR